MQTHKSVYYIKDKDILGPSQVWSVFVAFVCL